MKVTVPFFKGEVPRQSSRLLSDGFAASATNCRLVSGDLTAWKEPTTHALSPLLPSSALQSIYKMQTLNGGNDVFLRSVDDVNWSKGIVAGDTTERIYFTGFRDDPSGAATPAVPKVTNFSMATGVTIHTGQTAGHYPNNWFKMGVPTPAEEPGASSVPVVSDEVLISDGTSTTPWTPTTNLTTSQSGAEITGAIKMTDPADTHTASDPAVGDQAGDTIRFDFEIEDDNTTLEFKFASTSAGSGPVLIFKTGQLLGAPSTITFGTSTTWTGTVTNIAVIHSLHLFYGGIAADQVYRANITLTENSNGQLAFNLILTRVATGQTVAELTYGEGVFNPEGTYFGFRTDPSVTGANAWFDNVYTALAADTEDATSTSYVYTWLNEFGEESAPSPASETVRKSNGLTTTISGIDDPSAGQVTDYGLSNTGSGTKRLYRAATGPDGETNFFFVADIDYGTTTYVDSVPDADLGEAIESTEWALPPTDGHSIIMAPNGICFMASKNQIFPSETNRPHASLPDYALTTDFDIVGLGAIDSTIIVLTKSNPYIVVGSDPRQLSMAKLELPYGCSAKRSISHLFGFGVIYSSPDGLVSINGAGVNLIGGVFFSREQWQTLTPSGMYAFVHDDKYFFTYNDGAAGVYIFDPKETGIGLSKISLTAVSGFDNAITAAYSDPLTDKLHFIHSTNKLAIWNAHASNQLEYTWKSKVYQLPHAMTFEAAQVKGSSFGSGISFKTYADGSLYYTKAVTADGEFVLPIVASAIGAKEFQIEVIGKATLSWLEAAEVMEELR